MSTTGEEEAPEGADLSELPPEVQAAAWRRAARIGVSEREPELMKLLMTLEYYSYLTNRVPEQIEVALAGAASGITGAGEIFAGKLETAMTDAAAGLRQSVLAAASAVSCTPALHMYAGSRAGRRRFASRSA